jgi:AsmA protein
LLAWLGLKTYEVVDFNDFVVNFNIDRGKAKVNDWALSSKVGDFLLNGTIGLNGSVNMDIATTLSKEHSNIVKKYHGDWIFPIDSKARATIDIKVSGSFTSPNFSLDKNKIKERIKGKVKNEFENKKKEWEAKIKNLLNK